MRGNFSCEMFAKNLRKMRRKFCGQQTCEIQAKNPGSESSLLVPFLGNFILFYYIFLSRAETAACVGVCVCVWSLERSQIR